MTKIIKHWRITIVTNEGKSAESILYNNRPLIKDGFLYSFGVDGVTIKAMALKDIFGFGITPVYEDEAEKIDSKKETDVSVCGIGLSKLWGIDFPSAPLATDTQNLSKALTLADERVKRDVKTGSHNEASDLLNRIENKGYELLQLQGELAIFLSNELDIKNQAALQPKENNAGGFPRTSDETAALHRFTSAEPQRWAAIGKTDIQTGIMALVRALKQSAI